MSELIVKISNYVNESGSFGNFVLFVDVECIQNMYEQVSEDAICEEMKNQHIFHKIYTMQVFHGFFSFLRRISPHDHMYARQFTKRIIDMLFLFRLQLKWKIR